MTMQQVHYRILQLGTFSFSNPLLWVAAAIVAFVLLSDWPALLAEPVQAQAGAVSAPAAIVPVATYVSSDPSLPSAASVFAGRPYEASQQIDGF